MFRPRVIPTLLLRGQALVKSIGFKKHRYIGDPMNAVKIFNDLKADELIFLDIEASKNNRLIPIQFVKDVGAEANMPFSVGGGIRTLSDIREIIGAGAERVVINSAAIEDPTFVQRASQEFGTSTITVCLDVKKKLFSGHRVWSHGGKRAAKFRPLEFAQLMEEMGAGELVVQSITQDGAMSGYDVELTSEISKSVKIPVVALGGAGNLDHLKTAYTEGHASGLAAGSIFVYHGPKRGVLINYPERHEIKEMFG